jgi:hypothetical protein
MSYLKEPDHADCGDGVELIASMSRHTPGGSHETEVIVALQRWCRHTREPGEFADRRGLADRRLQPYLRIRGRSKRTLAPEGELGVRSSRFAVSGRVSVVIGRVVICSEEVERHVGIVANDPAVVRHRSDVEQVTGVEFGHLAVGERRGRDPGEDQAHVLHQTVAEAECGTDVRRPSPTRLIRRPSDCRACEPHHLEAAELKVSHFIGLVETPKDRSNVGHQHAHFLIASAARHLQLGKDVPALGRILVR